VSSETALARIVAALDSAGIPHMVAGSFASTFHGDARTTQDVDLVIDPSRDALQRFVACGASLDRAYIERWARASSVSTPSGSAPPPMRHADRCRPPW
jgi:hypothetical protein